MWLDSTSPSTPEMTGRGSGLHLESDPEAQDFCVYGGEGSFYLARWKDKKAKLLAAIV